jgi:DNA processing protein
LAGDNGLTAWLRLEQTAGVGPETARKLLSAFGLPENIFSASFAVLRDVVSERVARALLAPLSDKMQAQIDRTLDWAAQPANRVLTLADTDYPRLLLDIPDPPLLLYTKGRTELLHATSVAVVGSRNASAQGIANARNFAEAMSAAGLHTVSGLALGIDAAAHEGSLQRFTSSGSGSSGSTVAVIGTGIDIVYPARNRELAHRIAADGCIVSEYPLGMPAIASNFPRRNRIISGLARGTLVVEAAEKSGSLITARMAAEQGRDVFAIPGSIHSPLAKGCHQLIKQGAKLVESAEDILEELQNFVGATKPGIAKAAMPKSNFQANPVPDHPLLARMGFDAIDISTLAIHTGMDAATLSGELLTLELDGAVEMLPSGEYRRVA